MTEKETYLAEEDCHRVLEEMVGDPAIVNIASTDDLERDLDDRRDTDRGVLALEFNVEEGLGADRLPLKLRRAEALAVPSADLAEDAHRRVRVLVVERQRAKELP